MESQLCKSDIAQKVHEIRYFPVPNSIVLSLFRTITQKNCTFDEISTIVEPDASLCAQLLRVANSAYFGFRGKVNTIEKAVMLIGVDEVRNLSLAICLVNQFRNVVLAKGFDIKRFWVHNLMTASCAQEICKDKQFLDKNELYLMGLLHDIGRLAMAQLMPDEFNYIEVKARRLGVHPWAVEQKLGMTHTEVGYLLASRWGLSDQMAQVLEFHHSPMLSKGFSRECAVVAVAAHIAKMVEASSGVGPEPVLPDTKVFLLAGIELNQMDLFYEKAMNLKDEIDNLANIIVGQS